MLDSNRLRFYIVPSYSIHLVKQNWQNACKTDRADFMQIVCETTITALTANRVNDKQPASYKRLHKGFILLHKNTQNVIIGDTGCKRDRHF